MTTSNLLAACFIFAAQTYHVPEAVLIGLYKTEGGEIGQEVKNTNGTSDLGPMQINSLWVPQLAQKWGVSEDTAYGWLRDDGCTNIGVSAWVLRTHLDATGSMSKAIEHYHSKTPRFATRYGDRFLDVMEKNGLIAPAAAAHQE